MPGIVYTLILLSFLSCLNAFVLHHPSWHQPRLKASSNNDDTAKDEDDPQPYRNRSLTWSNRFRKLIPYETARKQVIAMGFFSKEDWDEYVADGKKYHGPYLASHPDEMYADDWVSWEEFLGLRRNYDDCRHVVQNVLKLQTLEEYTAFVKTDAKRAEYLRIPLKPQIVYKKKGWISCDHFFGTMQ